MESPYKNFRNLKKASVNQRLTSATEVVINEIAKGKSIERMKGLKVGFDEDGQYEFSTAIDLAIDLYKMYRFNLQ